jgi:outer membrane biosynthesis protein TonB
MKTRIIVLIASTIFILTGTSAFARTPSEKLAISSAKVVRNIVNETIKYPSFGYKNNLTGNVSVSFTILDDGTVGIRKISSESEDLESDVKKELANIDFSDVVHQEGQIFHITLYFSPRE